MPLMATDETINMTVLPPIRRIKYLYGLLYHVLLDLASGIAGEYVLQAINNGFVIDSRAGGNNHFSESRAKLAPYDDDNDPASQCSRCNRSPSPICSRCATLRLIEDCVLELH